MARALQALGRVEEAQLEVATVLRAAPHNPEAQAIYDELCQRASSEIELDPDLDDSMIRADSADLKTQIDPVPGARFETEPNLTDEGSVTKIKARVPLENTADTRQEGGAHPYLGRNPAALLAPPTAKQAQAASRRPAATTPPRLEPRAPLAAPSDKAARPAKSGRRMGTVARLPRWMWAVLAAAVLGAGLTGGLAIRRIRIEKQIETRVAEARALTKKDTYAAWRGAEVALDAVADKADRAVVWTELALVRVILRTRFAQKVDVSAALERVPPGPDRSLLEAMLWAETAAPADAASALTKLQGLAMDASWSESVRGRLALRENRVADARAAFERAVSEDPRPMTRLDLAEALLAAGDQAGSASQIDLVLTEHPKQVRAFLLRARSVLVAGRARTERGWVALQELASIVQDNAAAPSEHALAHVLSARLMAERGLPDAARDQLRPEYVAGADADLAEAWLALGDARAAQQIAQEVLHNQPQHAGAKLALAAASLERSDPKSALDVLDSGGETIGARSLLLRGIALLALNQTTAGAKVLDQAIAAFPESADAVAERVFLDLELGNLDTASARLAPWLQSDEELRPSIIQLAQVSIARATGRYAEAKAAVGALTSSPVASFAHLELGRIHRMLGEWDAAKAALERVTGRSTPAAIIESALLADNRGDLLGARDQLEAWAAKGQPSARALIELVRLRILTGAPELARELLKRLEQDRGSVAAWEISRERGRLALRAGQFSAAAKVLRATTSQERDPAAYLLLIDALLASGDTNGAQRVHEQVLTRFPGRPERYLAAGRIALTSGRPKVAEAAFERAERELQVTNHDRERAGDAAFGLAIAALAQGATNAELLLENAARTDSAHVDARFALGELAAAKGRNKAALEYFRAAVRLNPEYADAWLAAARAAHAVGEPTELAAKAYLNLAPEGSGADEARALAGESATAP